jgi:8-oxo-dGTP pyrophosphatase MutT (NUDIX family)
VGLRTARPARLSAGVIVVRCTPREWLFLMLRAYRNWDFPKGVVEAGEEPLAAARREVREETLIEDLAFRWGEGYIETPPYGHNKVARYYLAETATAAVTLPIQPELGRPEHNEWRWLSYAEARGRASPRLERVIGWGADLLGLEQA